MAHELDDIAAQTECPLCGRALNIAYKTLRLARTIDCPGCGETIRPIDDTPIGRVQKLIDEAGRQSTDRTL
ncbi:hypothetical protein QLH51_04290 [Sphingomonas sp. 2R-10]|uniref:hypothetical protein n=1 Tax=Sphingomonas sp. 2R-10 TaxID=3045148 RepID=UPI0024BA3975|nr:hypothetical protein [Sphingomonas sp. 2R-10]MDJ0276023.1 hypothetical protein [Sphingomonas sp. 2R-10]